MPNSFADTANATARFNPNRVCIHITFCWHERTHLASPIKSQFGPASQLLQVHTLCLVHSTQSQPYLSLIILSTLIHCVVKWLFNIPCILFLYFLLKHIIPFIIFLYTSIIVARVTSTISIMMNTLTISTAPNSQFQFYHFHQLQPSQHGPRYTQ